ncbi:MAG: hypothetical protein ACLUKN_08250 [Bacilli bacterium]
MQTPGWRSAGELIVGIGLLLMGLDFLKSSVPELTGLARNSVAAGVFKYGFLSVLLFLAFE